MLAATILDSKYKTQHVLNEIIQFSKIRKFSYLKFMFVALLL